MKNVRRRPTERDIYCIRLCQSAAAGASNCKPRRPAWPAVLHVCTAIRQAPHNCADDAHPPILILLPPSPPVFSFRTFPPFPSGRKIRFSKISPWLVSPPAVVRPRPALNTMTPLRGLQLLVGRTSTFIDSSTRIFAATLLAGFLPGVRADCWRDEYVTHTRAPLSSPKLISPLVFPPSYPRQGRRYCTVPDSATRPVPGSVLHSVITHPPFVSFLIDDRSPSC
jgi:hypothetical protein